MEVRLQYVKQKNRDMRSKKSRIAIINREVGKMTGRDGGRRLSFLDLHGNFLFLRDATIVASFSYGYMGARGLVNSSLSHRYAESILP